MSEYSIVSFVPQYSLGSSFLAVILHVFESLAIALCPFCLVWFGMRLVVDSMLKAVKGGDLNV